MDDEFLNEIAFFADEIRILRRKSLSWFKLNARDLPWRGVADPYKVWVSEIMLQQTQVVTVVPYFNRFIKRFPTVKKLAAANREDVLKLWEGLGYYRRARQLHEAAQQVVKEHKGEFPTNFDDVHALKGIGRYTAGAILSISLDQSIPILEGNTIRLYARLLDLDEPVDETKTQKTLWRFAESIIPKKNCGNFNQALMEIGSEICKPKSPLCGICPIIEVCHAKRSGREEQLPIKKTKIKYVSIVESSVVIERKGKYLVRQCGENEWWTGLWDFPRFRIEEPSNVEAETSQKCNEQTGFSIDLSKPFKTIKHTVTNHKIELRCYRAESISGRKSSKTDFVWVSKKELAKLPLSVTGRKIARAIT